MDMTSTNTRQPNLLLPHPRQQLQGVQNSLEANYERRGLDHGNIQAPRFRQRPTKCFPTHQRHADLVRVLPRFRTIRLQAQERGLVRGQAAHRTLRSRGQLHPAEDVHAGAE